MSAQSCGLAATAQQLKNMVDHFNIENDEPIKINAIPLRRAA